MPEPVNTIQTQPAPDPVSVPIGRPEGAPAVVSSPVEANSEASVDSVVEHGAEFAPPPEVSEELSQHGVTSNSDQAQVTAAPGISNSIPAEVVSDYKSIFVSTEEAEAEKKKGDPNTGKFGQALEYLKNAGRLLRKNQTSEAH